MILAMINDKDPDIGSMEDYVFNYIVKNTLDNNEDICWLKDGSILTSKNDKLYKFNPKTDKKWIEICNLSEYGINNISRIAINPNNDKLALVNSK